MSVAVVQGAAGCTWPQQQQSSGCTTVQALWLIASGGSSAGSSGSGISASSSHRIGNSRNSSRAGSHPPLPTSTPQTLPPTSKHTQLVSPWGLHLLLTPPPYTHTRAPIRLSKLDIQCPIKQHAYGTKGCYRCILVEQKKLSAEEFREIAQVGGWVWESVWLGGTLGFLEGEMCVCFLGGGCFGHGWSRSRPGSVADAQKCQYDCCCLLVADLLADNPPSLCCFCCSGVCCVCVPHTQDQDHAPPSKVRDGEDKLLERSFWSRWVVFLGGRGGECVGGSSVGGE